MHTSDPAYGTPPAADTPHDTCDIPGPSPGTSAADANIESMGDLYTSGRQVVQDLSALGSSVGQLAKEASQSLHTLAKERPYVAIALAAGAGFVLAGGLGTRVTRSLLGLGGKMLLRTVVAGGLGAIAATQHDDESDITLMHT